MRRQCSSKKNSFRLYYRLIVFIAQPRSHRPCRSPRKLRKCRALFLPYTTLLTSLRRRIVDRTAAAAGVLHGNQSSCHPRIARPNIRDGVGSSGDRLVATLAVPDTGVRADCVRLSAECASVLGVLADFDLLDLLTERCTVTALTVLAAVPRGCMKAHHRHRPTVYRIYR